MILFCTVISNFVYFLAFFMIGCVRSLYVTGYKGRTVIIDCMYNQKEKDHHKYFCKRGVTRLSCDKIIVANISNMWIHKERFSLYDSPENNQLTVIIRDLSDNDQTDYWCAQTFTSMLKLCFMTADCCRTSESKAAYLGGSVTIDCKYPESEESNIRYFCKEDGNLYCKNVIMARAEHNNTRIDRFILSNSRMNGVYRVTISALTEEDAGKYWCAMKRTEPASIAKLTEVHLSVVIPVHMQARLVKLHSTDSPFSILVKVSSFVAGTSVYTAVSVSLAVLLIVLTLLIIYKYKMHKKQDNSCLSLAVHSLYATVSMPTQALDFPHYASVIFQKRPGADSEATVSFSTGSCSTPATDKPDLSTCLLPSLDRLSLPIHYNVVNAC
uniref:Immunoglobulin domain-containing protein n=1 Tax=Myripristis murdjan TaxID=586833 RepID=A0A668ASJ1_9TELE